MDTMINEGDLILLYRDEKHTFLVRAENSRFHTDKGYLDCAGFIGKEWGDKATTNLDEPFYLLKPTLHELIMKVNRQTQIMYPKDIGLLLTKTTVFPGARVIEVGSGSGALTTALAHFIRPDGKIFSYERREDLQRNAMKNLRKNGLQDLVEFKLREVKDGFDETDVDFIMIDIGSPWELIDAAYASLKGGCRLASICPTFDQLTTTVFTLEEKGFTNIETIEVLVRRILVRRNRTRPEQQMPSHTGFLVFASKINR